ncbi:MAG: hypothetical protein V3U99_08990, partial [Alphaproteobacteria bacterium]
MVKRAKRRRRGGAEDAHKAPFYPADILKDWWDAVAVTAAALAGAPLRLSGIKTAKLKPDQLAASVRGFP